jgi:hypothetical protein
MPTEELIAHLNCHHRMADFIDVTLLFTVCEHRLTKIKDLVRVGDERMDMLWDKIRVRKA